MEVNTSVLDVDDFPWVTSILAAGMVAIYIADPVITPLSYTALAPWMHASWPHLWRNLLVFVLLGAWIEIRVGRVTYLFFAVMVPYLALYFPIVFEYGGLSRGASGLTKALTGYALPVLLVELVKRVESFQMDMRKVATGALILLVFCYLTVDSLVTAQRFLGLTSRPNGVSVASHMTGLILGVLWFGWRAWRYGMDEA